MDVLGLQGFLLGPPGTPPLLTPDLFGSHPLGVDEPRLKSFDPVEEGAAGEKAVRHAKPVSLRKKRLVVNVDGSSWLYELTLKKESLLTKMKQRLGEERIKELQFRIGEL